MADLFVGLENNQKILIPTSSEARSGNPLGTILAIHSNVVPYGYLPCNGVAFDENQYPALYALLGDNHTPVEGHTPDWNNAESITISTTDYVVQKGGWLVGKGLCTQGYEGNIYVNNTVVSVSDYTSGGFSYYNLQIEVKKGDIVKSDRGFATQDFHFIPYLHPMFIKATSGLEETQQDYVLQSLLEADSYSTEEVATGKKWIDGKMIYKKVVTGAIPNGTVLVSGASTMIRQYGNMDLGSAIGMFPSHSISGYASLRQNKTSGDIYAEFSQTWTCDIVVEYTKTTD